MNLRPSLCASSAIVVLAIAASLSGLTPARGHAPSVASSTPAPGGSASGAQAGAASRKAEARQGTTRKPVKKPASAASNPPAAASTENRRETLSFWQSDLFIAFLLCPLYWLAMVTVRWHRVAHTTRALLRAQIYSLMTELSALATTSSCAAGAGLMKLLESAKALLDGPREKSGLPIANVLFWSRGQEMTGWGYVHEVEVQMVPCLGDETVTAKLETAERTLRASNDGPCVALANVIHEALVSIPPAALPRRRALLAEALAANYSREDNEFSDLVSWQNKASWLVVCGLLLILALTGAYPQHSILLLVGATGGLLSRLSRSLDRKSVPTDYGASWTTLFLSPVAGALAAWAGILIADLATQAKVLGATFSADWLHPNDTQTLALALLFGFSERLLDTVLDKLEGTATGAQTQPPKQQAPPTPPPQPQAGPPPTALTITTATLPQGQLNQPYAQLLAAANAVGTVTWSVSQGPLPDGLHLGGDGKLTGVPTKQGTFSFTVTAADQQTTAHQVLTVTIA